MEPINQSESEEDTLIPGLCAFLLGICYEFNREPGEITRYSVLLFAIHSLTLFAERKFIPLSRALVQIHLLAG